MSNKLLEFIENGSPVTCLQFHPYEFLMAAGRNDGSVDLYDLESKQMISRVERREAGGNSVKCITFSDSGECLFVGTTQNISVIGWEPDQEFDRIESNWSHLGDMKIINRKLICGGYENRNVTIHAMSLDYVIPFYNPPTNVVPSFTHQQSSRKSFNRGSSVGKLRLSIEKKSNGSATLPVVESGNLSSPNLSIEMIEEDLEPLESIPPDNQFEFYALNKFKTNAVDYGNNLTTNGNGEEKYQLSKIISEDQQETTTIVHGFPLPDDEFRFDKPTNLEITGYSSDVDTGYYSPSRFILHNVSTHEDFTVNSAQQPDYAPKLPQSTVTTNASTAHNKPITAKQKMLENHEKRRASPPNSVVRATNLRKTSATSVSTVDLRKIDEQFSNISTSQSQRKPISRGSSPIRNNNSVNSKIRKSESSYQVKSNNQKNLTVQIFSKPQRSKTAIDIKAAASRSSIPRSVQSPIQLHHHQQQQQQQQQQQLLHSYLPATNAILQPTPHIGTVLSTSHQFSSSMHHETMLSSYSNHVHSAANYETASESLEIQSVLSGHDMLFNTLCNRITSLDMIRNQMR
jgi:katanin p80 WD40 repeat-containing subunit B1